MMHRLMDGAWGGSTDQIHHIYGRNELNELITHTFLHFIADLFASRSVQFF
jgi:hypothetical protein